VELESEIDRLYGVPLDEFVRDRDELVKRLRREGEREAADRVKGLRKPSAGAWALNQAVRRRRKETDALLAAGERLRQAHESLLSGGDPAELREAMQEERNLASGLADCAEAIASETGKSGPALRERVRSTLHAATVDEEAREELTRGRFVREREAAGLGPFGAGATGAAPPRSRTKRARVPAKDDRAGGAGKRAGAPARATAGDGSRGAGAAAKERSAAAREEAAAQERRERLAEAERSLEEARAALEEAEASHREAAAELQAAREAVGVAEDAEREARAVARERRREAGKLERELERLRGKSR
jgi:hypothetical protein